MSLAPIDGRYKIYIVSDADLFNDSSANALLKTLEEPPDDVVIILMAHSFDAVIPTIASRCQVVRFRRIPAEDAAAMLVSITGADPAEAAMALAAAGGVVARARDFLASSPRREARAMILRTLKDLAAADELDVLVAAKELLAAVKAPLEDVKASQSARGGRAGRLPGQVRQQGAGGAAQARADRSRARGNRRGAQRRGELASGLLGAVARSGRSGRQLR